MPKFIRDLRALLRTWGRLLAYALLLGGVGYAQSIGGKIVGTVTDSTGAVIPQAAVEVTNEGTGAQRHLVTDDAGNYVVPELSVGFYTVKVEAQNFAAFIRKKIKVEVATDTHLDVQLTAQALSQTVTVTEESPQMERRSEERRVGKERGSWGEA